MIEGFHADSLLKSMVHSSCRSFQLGGNGTEYLKSKYKYIAEDVSLTLFRPHSPFTVQCTHVLPKL